MRPVRPNPVRTSSAISKNIVSGRQAADSGQKFLGMNDHSSRALKQRLDNHSSNFIATLGKQALQLVKAFDVANRRE